MNHTKEPHDNEQKDPKYPLQIIFMFFIFLIFMLIFFNAPKTETHSSKHSPPPTNAPLEGKIDIVKPWREISSWYTIYDQYYFVPDDTVSSLYVIDDQIGEVKRIGDGYQYLDGDSVLYPPGTKIFRIKNVSIQQKIGVGIMSEKEGVGEVKQIEILKNVGSVSQTDINSKFR